MSLIHEHKSKSKWGKLKFIKHIVVPRPKLEILFLDAIASLDLGYESEWDCIKAIFSLPVCKIRFLVLLYHEADFYNNFLFSDNRMPALLSKKCPKLQKQNYSFRRRGGSTTSRRAWSKWPSLRWSMPRLMPKCWDRQSKPSRQSNFSTRTNKRQGWAMSLFQFEWGLCFVFERYPTK